MFERLKKLIRKKPEVIMQQKRHKCPFYGFNGMYGMFMDSNGNQCALITDSCSPCPMEMRHEAPNWNGCAFNSKENEEVLKAIDELQCYPKEFDPPERKTWQGIPFKQWREYVLGNNVPRFN